MKEEEGPNVTELPRCSILYLCYFTCRISFIHLPKHDPLTTLSKTWYSSDGETEDQRREIIFQRSFKETTTQVSQLLFQSFLPVS